MSERPRVLDQLGAELDRVARSNLTRPGGMRVAPRRLSVAIVLVLLLAFAAAATAAVLLIQRGSPLPAAHARDLESSGVPLPGSAYLAGLAAPDPDPSAPAWDIRLSHTRAGETCTAVGQVLDGQFGIVGLDHVFRALPLGGVDACGVHSPTGPLLAGARVFVGTTPREARTVVNGVAGDGARSVTVYGPGGARTLRLGPDGSFITVYRGYVEEVRPRVVVVTRAGASHTIAFAQSAAFEVADPKGGSPWQVSGEADLRPGAYPDENCAQASQELGRSDPSESEASLTPLVCGRLGRQPVFFSMRRFVPGGGRNTGFPWGNNPARTLIYGAAAPRVASLALSGPGVARTISIDPHGGVFLAVLDGHIDPRELKLTVRLRSGRSRAYARSANLLDYRSSRPLHEPPIPAYRAPLPASQAEFPPLDLPQSSTVRETLRARDPGDGPEWALRSWRGPSNPRANFGAGYHPTRFICEQVGVIERHRLVEPRPGLTPLPLSIGQEGDLDGGCSAPGDLARFGPAAQAISYLENPYAYSPRPLRTVIGGVLWPDATHPLLLGAGKARPLALDANHAFLAVLPGRYWDAPLRIAAVVDGRTVHGSVFRSFPPGSAPAAMPQARAPDPDGGAPWGFAAGAEESTAAGRIVEGRFASIDERSGRLQQGPEGWSGGGEGPNGAGRRAPVRFDTQGGSEESLPGQSGSALPRPEVQRRTLPGRTVITGTAAADVTSITLATPRDVRTLRPSGPEHVFIVVYDGQFFRGAITATIALSDGRTVTESVPNGPGGIDASAPPVPSLAARLRGARRQLRQERQRHHGLPRSAPAPPPIATVVHVIEARIAYERAHPGVLPPE